MNETKQNKTNSESNHRINTRLWRPICITEDIRLGSCTTEEEATRAAKAHKRQYPHHRVDIESC